jgi:GT2 family glycosyltransferase
LHDTHSTTTEPDRIAVLVPTLDDEAIVEVVASVLAQDGADRLHEVLIVGRDAARRLERSGLLAPRAGPAVRFVDTVVPVSEARARNLALRATRAGWLVFLDSDCFAQPGWLRAHRAAWTRGAQIVGGSVLPQGDSYWALVYNLSMFYGSLPSLPAGPRPALPTLNLSCARAVFDTVGAFDEALPRATDLDWTLRARQAGYTLYFEPGAAVHHRHRRRTLPAVWRDCAGSGRYARSVRLRRAAGPRFLRWPLLVRLSAPLLAAIVVVRVLLRWRGTFTGRWHTLPGFALTKLAWGWGAGRR